MFICVSYFCISILWKDTSFEGIFSLFGCMCLVSGFLNDNLIGFWFLAFGFVIVQTTIKSVWQWSFQAKTKRLLWIVFLLAFDFFAHFFYKNSQQQIINLQSIFILVGLNNWLISHLSNQPTIPIIICQTFPWILFAIDLLNCVQKCHILNTKIVNFLTSLMCKIPRFSQFGNLYAILFLIAFTC